MKIVEKIKEAYKCQFPFVVYRKPNEKRLSAFFQENTELYYTKNYVEEGFVFAPFDDTKPSILIPKNKSLVVQEEFLLTESDSELINNQTENSIEREYHIQLVKRGVESIQKGEFKKVVLSRKEEVHITNFELEVVFKRLLNTYPTAFVYVWFHPKVGLWFGATPETLVSIKGKKFTTMSLAGTQEYKDTLNVEWKAKEIEEQQLVTDYVVEKLNKVADDVTLEDLETIKAGNLLHLRTKIQGKFQGSPEFLIKTLHPTPAVCGFPKKKSKEFILKHENYKRSYYTGFLGELNFQLNNDVVSNLFVNLRCMEINNTMATIYVGGGITKDSDAIKEWEETCAKSKVMKRVL